jgi:hypothetical protein
MGGLQQGQRESFRSQFWREIKNNLRAHDAMQKVPSGSRNRVVRLLEAVSDPEIEVQMRRLAPEFNGVFVPSKKKLAGLADRLRTMGRELEQIAEMPGFVVVLDFAQQCRDAAGTLDTLRTRTSTSTRHLNYKSFWQCVPGAMLCRELVDSKLLSFGEAESLVRCADNARGLTHSRSKRSVERQYKRFMKYRGRSASLLVSAAWPISCQRFLDGMLRIVPTR